MNILSKRNLFMVCALFICGKLFPTVHGEQNALPVKTSPIEETVLRESLASLQRGVNFLTDRQLQDGSWCEHPAMTALACIAIHNSGKMPNFEILKQSVEKGRKYLLSFVQKDGSIWVAGREKEYPNYTTAICLAALAIIGNQEDEAVMKKARKYLLGSQVSETNPSNPSSKDDPFYGGMGYASSGPGRPDLSNTQWALEALYLTDYLDKETHSQDTEDAKKSQLAWKNAVMFLSRLQHLPESNDQVWVIKDKNDPNYGGFVYKPDESKASLKFEDKNTLRSYGSMTYAGLKSMIYAKLAKDDPRVKAANEWAAKNYTLNENPGMGSEGHYYYLNLFAKAHAAMGDDFVETPDGVKHSWRNDLLKKMLELQKSDGHWHNEKNGRWMEAIPELITAYSIIAMEAALGPDLPR
jgi:squalene-hopene/tetraprenyl-beta-curcumene cyclase